MLTLIVIPSPIVTVILGLMRDFIRRVIINWIMVGVVDMGLGNLVVLIRIWCSWIPPVGVAVPAISTHPPPTPTILPPSMDSSQRLANLCWHHHTTTITPVAIAINEKGTSYNKLLNISMRYTNILYSISVIGWLTIVGRSGSLGFGRSSVALCSCSVVAIGRSISIKVLTRVVTIVTAMGSRM